MNKERLLKLVDHLLNGKLIHDEFNFLTFNDINFGDQINGKEEFKPNGCGTVGCAIGELPGLFSEWYFKRDTSLISPHNFEPRLVESEELDYGANDEGEPYSFIDAAKFFGLTLGEIRVLFAPISVGRMLGKRILVNGHNIYQLHEKATKEEVANNILKFINAKESTASI